MTTTSDELQKMGQEIRDAADKVSSMMFDLNNHYEGLMGYTWYLLVRDQVSGKPATLEWINQDKDDCWDPQVGEGVPQYRFNRMQRVNVQWWSFWKGFDINNVVIEDVRKTRSGPVRSVIEIHRDSDNITDTLFALTKDDTESMAKIPEVLGAQNAILEDVSEMANRGENAAQTMMNNIRGATDTGGRTENGPWVGAGADAYHQTVHEQSSTFTRLRESSDSLQTANVALANDTNELMRAFCNAYEARVESTQRWGTQILGFDQLSWTSPVQMLYNELMEHEKKTIEEHKEKLDELADQAVTDLIVGICDNAQVTKWPAITPGSLGEFDH